MVDEGKEPVVEHLVREVTQHLNRDARWPGCFVFAHVIERFAKVGTR